MSARADCGQLRDDEAGITLVELIVYFVISALFLGLLAGLFVNGLQAQIKATDRDNATGTGSVAIETLSGSIRNAADFAVDADGQGLVAKVAVGTNGWQCRAWAVRNGELRYRSGTSVLDTANALTDNWGSIATGVGMTLTDGAGVADSAAFVDGGDRRLLIGITVSTGDTTVTADSSITAQAVSDGTDTTKCWNP